MYGLQRRFSKMFNWFLSAALTYLYRYTRPAIKWVFCIYYNLQCKNYGKIYWCELSVTQKNDWAL